MDEQAEEKLKSVNWPRRPGKLGFSSNLSRDDFGHLYLCRPRPERKEPKVTFEKYRDRHKSIDCLCDMLEEVFSRMTKIGSDRAFKRAFILAKRLEDKARQLGCHGDLLIEYYNPDLGERDSIKLTIKEYVRPVFIGFDLADGPDSAAKLTFTPPAPPTEVVIKAVIT